jgi:hypothetical protein
MDIGSDADRTAVVASAQSRELRQCRSISIMLICLRAISRLRLNGGVAGINRIVLGARHAGMRRTDYGDYSVESLIATTKSTLEVVDGVKVKECEAMRRSWKHWIEPK